MRTVVVGPNPEVDALIARRRELALDRYDEVWDDGRFVPTDGSVVLDVSCDQMTAGLARD